MSAPALPIWPINPRTTSSRWPQITHHVPRIAPMGARVLINGTRYRERRGASAHHAGERIAGTSGGVRNRGGAGLAQFWQTREKSVMACLPWTGTLTVWHLMTLSVAK